MKLLLLLPLLFLSTLSPAQNIYLTGSQLNHAHRQQNYNRTDAGRAVISLLDSIHGYDWSNGTQSWTLSSRTINTYDGYGNLLTALELTQNGGWQNSNNTVYTYDANNNRLTEVYQFWNAGSWGNSAKSIYTYNGNNQVLTLINQSWISNAWQNQNLYTYTYNGSNDMTMQTTQPWLTASSTWQTQANNQIMYTYNGNHQVTTSVEQTWSGSAWVNSEQITNTYNGNNKLTNSLVRSWDGSNWVNAFQTNYTYDASNRETSATNQYWTGSAWVTDDRTTNYTYDADDNLTSLTQQYWTGSTYQNGYKEDYYYRTLITGINNPAKNTPGFKLFPNPAFDSFTISSTVPFSGKAEIMMYDNSGSLVYKETIAVTQNLVNKTIYTTNLKPGVYTVVMQNGNQILNSNLVVE